MTLTHRAFVWVGGRLLSNLWLRLHSCSNRDEGLHSRHRGWRGTDAILGSAADGVLSPRPQSASGPSTAAARPCPRRRAGSPFQPSYREGLLQGHAR
jgi:hypothetical protein